MLTEHELRTLVNMLQRASKHQLLTIIQHIEQFPLKNQMTAEEYCLYYNQNMKGKNYHDFYLKKRKQQNTNN